MIAEGGLRQPIGRLSSGDACGELAIMTGDTLRADFLAEKPCEVLRIPVTLFRSVTMSEPKARQPLHKMSSRILVPPPQSLSIRFTILDEEFVGRTIYTRQLTAVSACEARIAAETILPDLSNLKLEVQAVDSANPHGEIYAKVVGAADLDGGETLIRCTSVTPELKVWLGEASALTAAGTGKPNA